MRVVLGGERDRSICDADGDTLIAAARAQLRRVMSIGARPVFTGLARYPLGLPQYRVGHEARIVEMDRALQRLPGLYVIGNAFRGRDGLHAPGKLKPVPVLHRAAPVFGGVTSKKDDTNFGGVSDS